MLLLSCAATKRGLYLLPLMPAMMVLLAAWVDKRCGSRSVSIEKLASSIILGLAFALGLILPFVYVFLFNGSRVVAAVSLILTGASLAGLLTFKRFDAFLTAVLAWVVVMVAWVSVMTPVVDQHKSYKDAFVTMGRQVSGQRVSGYMLNESVEAFSLYYGGFCVKNIEDEDALLKYLAKDEAGYLIILPGRLEPGRLRQALSQRAECVFVYRSKYVKPVELWRRLALSPNGPLGKTAG